MARGVPGEGPDCHFPKDLIAFGPIPARIRKFLIFILALSTPRLCAALEAPWRNIEHLHAVERPICEAQRKTLVPVWEIQRCAGFVWVPEGSLAGCFGGAVLGSGRPRGPGKALKNVGGFAPHIFEGFLWGPRGRPDLKNSPPKIRPGCRQVLVPRSKTRPLICDSKVLRLQRSEHPHDASRKEGDRTSVPNMRWHSATGIRGCWSLLRNSASAP